MTDMVFEGNSASRNGGGIYGGGNLSNAVFRDNMAGERGGGLHGGGTLMDVTFEGNSAGMGGGGMDGTGTLTHVTFLNNTAPLGGGMATSGATLDQVIFEGNRAESRGGGMDSIGTSTRRDVTFRGNVGGDGGGMFSAGWSALTNVVFEHNQAHSPSSLPSFGGGMNIMFGSPSLVNVLFYNNLADYGGGMANQADYGSGTPPSENISPTLTNVTLAGNVARIVGGGIFNRDSDPRIHNSILWANEAISGSQIYNDISTPTLAYCDIQDSGGSGPGWDGGLGTDLGNNLDADPGFRRPVDPAAAPTTDGDLRLRWGSPAIDAGHNDLLPPGVTTDLDGNPRIVNDTVDLGAYESQSRFAIYLPVLFRNWPP
jgi:predicted outer membrane repeat protein